MLLWNSGDYFSVWNRTHIERVVHLEHLEKVKVFLVWSYLEKYSFLNNASSPVESSKTLPPTNTNNQALIFIPNRKVRGKY